eukprot:m51a1_g9432 hypothetical protein (4159) ;mRNA; f:408019-433718
MKHPVWAALGTCMRAGACALVLAATALAAAAAVAAAVATSYDASACPGASRAPVRLSLASPAPSLRLSARVGPLAVVEFAGASLVVRSASAASRVYWSSAPGRGFLSASWDAAAARGRTDVQTVDRVWSLGAREAGVAGRLLWSSGPPSEAVPYNLSVSADGCAGRRRAGAAGSVRLCAAVAGVPTRVLVSFAVGPDERVFGLGAQYAHAEHSGACVPVVPGEPGVGRGRGALAWLVDALAGAPASGTPESTSTAFAHVVTTASRSYALDDETPRLAYSVWNFRDVRSDGEALVAAVLAPPRGRETVTRVALRVACRDDPVSAVREFVSGTGRPQRLPQWAEHGVTLWATGGHQSVVGRVMLLLSQDVRVAAVVVADWTGRRDDAPDGSAGRDTVWWNWEPDAALYPNWPDLVERLSQLGVRTLVYVNPHLVDVERQGKRGYRRNLYEEARAADCLVKDQAGFPYLEQYGSPVTRSPLFSAATVDLSVQRTVPSSHTPYGWFADMGERLPYDGTYSSGIDPMQARLRYPEWWAWANSLAIDGSFASYALFAARVATPASARSTRLLWLADQPADWDGLRASITATISAGLSGLGATTSDVGGSIVLRRFPVRMCASPELLIRWAEYSAIADAFMRVSDAAGLDSGAAARLASIVRMREAFVAYRARIQFLLGSDVLIAPVVRPGRSYATVYVPSRPAWFLLWTGELVFPGWQVVRAPLGRPCVLMAENSTLARELVYHLASAEATKDARFSVALFNAINALPLATPSTTITLSHDLFAGVAAAFDDFDRTNSLWVCRDFTAELSQAVTQASTVLSDRRMWESEAIFGLWLVVRFVQELGLVGQQESPTVFQQMAEMLVQPLLEVEIEAVCSNNESLPRDILREVLLNLKEIVGLALGFCTTAWIIDKMWSNFGKYTQFVDMKAPDCFRILSPLYKRLPAHWVANAAYLFRYSPGDNIYSFSQKLADMIKEALERYQYSPYRFTLWWLVANSVREQCRAIAAGSKSSCIDKPVAIMTNWALDHDINRDELVSHLHRYEGLAEAWKQSFRACVAEHIEKSKIADLVGMERKGLLTAGQRAIVVSRASTWISKSSSDEDVAQFLCTFFIVADPPLGPDEALAPLVSWIRTIDYKSYKERYTNLAERFLLPFKAAEYAKQFETISPSARTHIVDVLAKELEMRRYDFASWVSMRSKVACDMSKNEAEVAIGGYPTLACIMFEAIGMDLIDVEMLRGDIKTITVDLEMKLVQELHQKISGEIGNLTLEQLPYFSTIGKAKELVSFFRSHAEDFEGRIAHLNAQLQGYKFSLDLLNALVVVHGTLNPIIKAFACGKSFDISAACAELAAKGARSLVLSVAEDFTAKDLLTLYARSIANGPDEQVVALHVIVSAYAPLGEVEILFSNLLLWSMVSDPASGEIVFVRPGSVVWHIFVEFAVAPVGDEEFALRTSMDQVLECVPTLTWMQSAEVGNPASEYCLDDDALLVAKCLCHHVADMMRPEAKRATTRVFAQVLKRDITPEKAMAEINRFLASLKSNSRLSEAILRVKLAHGLGCKRTQNVCKLFEQQGYVLTPDFTTKMILLNDMMRANQNVVLTGGTGVGKTELLNMLALLVNEDSGMIPDLMDAAYRFLDTLCKDWNRLSASDKARLQNAELHRSTPKMLAFLSLVVRMVPILSDEERADIEKQPQDVDEADANAPNKVMMQLLSEVIIEFVRSQVQKHPNICLSAAMKRVLNDGSMCFAEEKEMLTFFEHFCVAKFKGVFHRILMHQRITAEEFKRQVEGIRRRTRTLNGGKAIVFIDECTSTQVMGLLKEVFIDGMIKGEKIEENIFWVAAMNQNQSPGTDPNSTQRAKAVMEDFTGVAGSEECMEFAVRPPPPSLQLQTIEFAALSHEQTEHFLSSLLDLRSRMGQNVGSPDIREGESESDQVRSVVMLCHEFVARQNISRIHVSIRDLVRCIDLYSYFRIHTQLFAESNSSAVLPPEKSELYEHWNALILSCAMAYYLRLPSMIHTCTGRDEQPRKLFAEEFDKRAAESRSPGLQFQNVVYGAMAKLFTNTSVPDGIAPTEILLENLFCVVVCIDINIALIIVGPPGCSKTLSFKIAIDNMKGSQSPRAFYKQFAHAHPFRYQCSEQSTDTEIESTYVSATSRQETFDSSRIGQSQQRCVVLLDEAGLPSERKESLKVVHYKLDHPVVASIILSNKVLDAAKTNRAIVVLQSRPSQDDLLSLARGCIFGSAYVPQTAAENKTERDNSLISALCSAYQRVNSVVEAQMSNTQRQGESGMFHLRDFVYFLRFLRRACNSGGNVEIRPDAIVASLQRNFGGVDKETFSKIVDLFFDEIGRALPQEHLGPSAPARERGTVETLSESLGEVISDTEDPNTAPFRFVMVIDPSDNEVAKDLLFSLGLCSPERTSIVSVGDFREDTGEAIRGDTILCIKNAMATGRTVLLTNALPISTSFYDVFNRHFDVLPVARDAQQNPSSSRRCEWYANVAVGSFSRPCYVHPDFRVIVHLPLSQLRRTPRPFLNRFEKFMLSPQDALQHKLRSLEEWQRNQFGSLHTSCLAFIEKVQPSLFYGLVPNDTVASLVLTSLEETKLAQSSPLRMPPPFVSGSPDAEFTQEAEVASAGSPREPRVEEEEALKRAVRQINFHLLQLARPEMVFFTDVLPQEYLFEYIMRQEHFSVLRLLERLAVASTSQPQPQASKWCVFTRSCGDLMRLHMDVAVQNSFLEPLLRGSSGKVSEKLAFIPVHEVKSSSDCATRIADFAKSDAQFLVCTADMGWCTACQINFLRAKIDELVPTSLGKITIVLLHFAPERVVLRSSAYHSVFLNSWSFLYVDSIGLSEGTAFCDSRKADTDTRTWLAHAFGLDVEITLDSVIHAFRSLFLHQLHLCCRRLCFVDACVDCVLSHKFYSDATDPEERSSFLLDLLEKKPFVLDGALKRFSALWGESILVDVVQSACREIREGRVMSNLMMVVKSSLWLLLQPVAEKFISLLCDNYALDLVVACEALGRPLEVKRKRDLFEDVVRWVLNTPHSTEQCSPVVRSNISLLLGLLVREGTVNPRLVSETLDIHWCVAFLHSVVGNKEEMWLSNITRELAEFVAKRVSKTMGPYAFMTDISDPSLETMGRAEYALFHLLHSAQPRSVENVAKLFLESDQRQELQTSLPDTVLSAVTRAAQASAVVSWCARALSPGDTEKQAQNFPATVLNVLKQIKEANWPCGTRPLFVRSLKDSFALDCLKNQQLLRVLHMEDLAIMEDPAIDGRSATIPLYLLPAMVNPQLELHAVIEDSIAGKYRMAVLLVLFFDYFRDGKSCGLFRPMVQGLRGVLDLTDGEARSYEFFITGFKDVDHDREIALHLFSEQVQKGPLTEELIYSYLMVNVLAVALGCPRDSNHLYCRIFELRKLSATYGPGSAFGRKNADCGYQMDKNGALLMDPSPPIMGNSRRLRLVLNTTVWMSICWATLLHPDAPLIARANSNSTFLNYVEEDAELFKFDMTPDQKVRFYVQWRAYTFYYWMRQSVSEDVDPVHLLNESLQQLWTATDNAGAPSGRAPQLVAEYPTKRAAVDYENVLKEKVFDALLSDPEAFERRKEPYISFVQMTGSMAQTLAIRKRLGAKLYSPVVPFSQVEEFMSRMPSEEQKGLEIVNHFRSRGMRSALRAIRHLPDLVHFYAILNKQFGWLLTEEDVNTKTFRQCVEMLCTTGENKSLLMALWKRFEVAWKEVCESVLPDACDAVMLERQFELLVLKVDEAVLMGRLISWENSDVDDHLVRMIEKGLASKQESMIRSAAKYDTPQFNPSGLVFDSTPQQISFRLRVSDTLERASMRLDATNLVREVLGHYVNGKCLFHPMAQFREVFRFKTGSEPAEAPTPSVQPRQMLADDAPQQDQFEMPGGAIRLINHHMIALEGAVQQIPQGNQFAAEFGAHTVIRNCSQEDLQRIAEALCTVAKEHVIPNLNAANAAAASATFKSTGVAFPPAADGFLGRPLSVFRSIAKTVHAKFVNREYLFSGIVNHRQYDTRSEPLEAELASARNGVLADAERIDEWTRAAESLLSVLQEGARVKLGYPERRVHKLFADEICALRLGANDIGALLPEDLSKWNFFQYLRWLHGLLGDLIAAGDAKAATVRKSNVFRRRARRPDAEVYVESAHILDRDIAAGRY